MYGMRKKDLISHGIYMKLVWIHCQPHLYHYTVHSGNFQGRVAISRSDQDLLMVIGDQIYILVGYIQMLDDDYIWK